MRRDKKWRDSTVHTYDEHLFGFDQGVEGDVSDDLAAVRAAVDEIHLV